MKEEYKNVADEAIRLLNISEKPGLYRQIRSWARKNIKHQPVAPADMIGFPKGCLLTGLMHQAKMHMNDDTSAGRAFSIKCLAEVRDYLKKWIDRGSEIYTIDDCLAGQALLGLTGYLQTKQGEKSEENAEITDADINVFNAAVRKMMSFLKHHDKDAEGSLPYRPMQKNGRIFADGIGMVLPFAIRYGLLFDDEEATELGMTQIRCFMKDGFDPETGLPWHAYSVNASDINKTEHFGALGWGRALGWIMYGIRASAEAFEEKKKSFGLSFTETAQFKELQTYLKDLCCLSEKHMTDEGLILSMLTENTGERQEIQENKADTSATAMVLYAMDMGPEALQPYIMPDGKVIQAQSECLDLGVYGREYGSYPWSVGMALMVLR